MGKNHQEKSFLMVTAHHKKGYVFGFIGHQEKVEKTRFIGRYVLEIKNFSSKIRLATRLERQMNCRFNVHKPNFKILKIKN